jgi:hypothetical protein
MPEFLRIYPHDSFANERANNSRRLHHAVSNQAHISVNNVSVKTKLITAGDESFS